MDRTKLVKFLFSIRFSLKSGLQNLPRSQYYNRVVLKVLTLLTHFFASFTYSHQRTELHFHYQNRQIYYSPSTSAEVKKMLIYISTPPYAFMAYCLIIIVKHMDNFTFY
jgi:hypothetical protein